MRVLAGLEKLGNYPSIRPSEVSVVAIRNFTEEEILWIPTAPTTRTLPTGLFTVNALTCRWISTKR